MCFDENAGMTLSLVKFFSHMRASRYLHHIVKMCEIPDFV